MFAFGFKNLLFPQEGANPVKHAPDNHVRSERETQCSECRQDRCLVSLWIRILFLCISSAHEHFKNGFSLLQKYLENTREEKGNISIKCHFPVCLWWILVE